MAKLKTKIEELNQKYFTRNPSADTGFDDDYEGRMRELALWVYNEMLPRSRATMRDRQTANEMKLKAIKIGLIKE